MITTCSDDSSFIEAVIGDTLLTKSIQWIKDNMSPGDVFEKKDLVEWAGDNGFIHESRIEPN